MKKTLAVALLASLSVYAIVSIATARDPFLRHSTAVDVVRKVGPSVVSITTERVVGDASPFRRSGNPFFDSFFRDHFERRAPQTTESLGSGVLIDAEGHILTNEHVVGRASRIIVSLEDGTEFEARVIGADPNNDIAVLQAETDTELPWISPATSSDLMVGESVIAIGNPFGLSSSVTTGVISALNRSVRAQNRVYHGFLQTDASINPGNSGGPLVNAAGELIGINTAVYTGGQGIGFAIPIDVAKRVVDELIEHGEVAPVWLGLDFQDLNPELRAVMDMPPGVSGALVNRVRKSSPAARAKLRRGDVVMRIDGQPVDSAQFFFEKLETSVDGQKVALSVWRNGNPQTIVVVLEEIPPDHVVKLAREIMGLKLEPNPAGGFVVKSVRDGSGAARIGFKNGDLVLGINGDSLKDSDALRRSILNLRGLSHALIVVQRGSSRYHVTIPLV
ncbi:MAG: trypsin-like peptidase domain-containing protein [Myxococcota bacterium]